ncbi:LPS assembly lipoprotein LptE [Neisseria leonii]|uniref:LPS-assembly lipoprotein LptE n=1 Tax=Neisseria leonii TaxID=2995413 RepID=A0A9X4E6W8_9NEIS|nr:LPS assembly lipoprotein LptE [Neisseria sp. 51.81]MDD9328307.1 LPS assembly lipoprotein LptE [Neisseria sp. 51.81]
MMAVLAVLAVLVLTACGFHLKGSGPAAYRLPYQNWSVDGGPLQQELESALRRAGGEPAADGRAQASLVVSRFAVRKNVYTVTRAALINEYLLELETQVQVYRNGEPFGEPFDVRVRRQMDYADGEALGRQEEEAQIRQEMRQDAAEQIVRRLAFMEQR